MCLLSQINPVVSKEAEEMQAMQQSHSHQICGITAHVKDRYVFLIAGIAIMTNANAQNRGVASVAIRSLAIAAECLVVRREQEEVLQIFDKIKKETGWRVGFLHKELKEKWGWNAEEALQAQQQSLMSSMTPSITSYAQYPSTSGAGSILTSTLPPAPPIVRRPPQGIVNPIFANADFTQQPHPYQNHYVAPIQSGSSHHHTQYNF